MGNTDGRMERFSDVVAGAAQQSRGATGTKPEPYLSRDDAIMDIITKLDRFAFTSDKSFDNTHNYADSFNSWLNSTRYIFNKEEKIHASYDEGATFSWAFRRTLSWGILNSQPLTIKSIATGVGMRDVNNRTCFLTFKHVRSLLASNGGISKSTEFIQNRQEHFKNLPQVQNKRNSSYNRVKVQASKRPTKEMAHLQMDDMVQKYLPTKTLKAFVKGAETTLDYLGSSNVDKPPDIRSSVIIPKPRAMFPNTVGVSDVTVLSSNPTAMTKHGISPIIGEDPITLSDIAMIPGLRTTFNWSTTQQPGDLLLDLDVDPFRRSSTADYVGALTPLEFVCHMVPFISGPLEASIQFVSTHFHSGSVGISVEFDRPRPDSMITDKMCESGSNYLKVFHLGEQKSVDMVIPYIFDNPMRRTTGVLWTPLRGTATEVGHAKKAVSMTNDENIKIRVRVVNALRAPTSVASEIECLFFWKASPTFATHSLKAVSAEDSQTTHAPSQFPRDFLDTGIADQVKVAGLITHVEFQMDQETPDGVIAQESSKEENTIITADTTIEKEMGEEIPHPSQLASSEGTYEFTALTARWMPLDTFTLDSSKKRGDQLLVLNMPEALYEKSKCAPNLTTFESYLKAEIDLEVRIMVNGQPFQCGKLIASYKLDSYQADSIADGYQGMLSRKHVILDIANKTSAEMLIPFRFRRAFLRPVSSNEAVSSMRAGKWTTFTITVLSPLKTGTDSVNTCEGQVFYRFKRTKLAGMSYRVKFQGDVDYKITSQSYRGALVGVELNPGPVVKPVTYDDTDNLSFGKSAYNVNYNGNTMRIKDILRRPTLIIDRQVVKANSATDGSGFFIPIRPPSRNMCQFESPTSDAVIWSPNVATSPAAHIVNAFRHWRGGCVYTFVFELISTGPHDDIKPIYITALPHGGTTLLGNNGCEGTNSAKIFVHAHSFPTEIVIPRVNSTARVQTAYDSENVRTLTWEEDTQRKYTFRDKGDNNAGHIVIASPSQDVIVSVFWEAADCFELLTWYGMCDIKDNDWAYTITDNVKTNSIVKSAGTQIVADDWNLNKAKARDGEAGDNLKPGSKEGDGRVNYKQVTTSQKKTVAASITTTSTTTSAPVTLSTTAATSTTTTTRKPTIATPPPTVTRHKKAMDAKQHGVEYDVITDVAEALELTKDKTFPFSTNDLRLMRAWVQLNKYSMADFYFPSDTKCLAKVFVSKNNQVGVIWPGHTEFGESLEGTIRVKYHATLEGLPEMQMWKSTKDFLLNNIPTAVVNVAPMIMTAGVATVPIIGQPLAIASTAHRIEDRFCKVADTSEDCLAKLAHLATKTESSITAITKVLEEGVQSVAQTLSGMINASAIVMDMFLDLIIAWIDKTWTAVGVGLVRLFTKILPVSLSSIMQYGQSIGQLFAEWMDNQGIARMQSEVDSDSFSTTLIGLLAGLVGTVLGVVIFPTDVTVFTSFLRRMTTTSGVSYFVQVIRFVKIIFSTIRDMVMKACGIVSPEAEALKVLSGKSEDIQNFIRDAQVVTSSFNTSCSIVPAFRMKFWRTVTQAHQLQRLMSQVPNGCVSPVVSKLCVDVIKAGNEKSMDLTSSPVRYEPYVICIEGPTGVGKSYLVDELAKRLLHSMGYRAPTSGMTYVRQPGNTYMPGYYDQPVLVYDDWMQVTETQSRVTQISELFALKTTATWMPNMAALEEKKIRGNPPLVFLLCNDAFPTINEVQCKEAAFRRRDLVIRVSKKSQYNNTPTREISPDVLSSYEHLEFQHYPDATARHVDPNTLNFQQFTDWLCNQQKRYHLQELQNVKKRMDTLFAVNRVVPLSALQITDPFAVYYNATTTDLTPLLEDHDTWITTERIERDAQELVATMERLAEAQPDIPESRPFAVEQISPDFLYDVVYWSTVDARMAIVSGILRGLVWANKKLTKFCLPRFEPIRRACIVCLSDDAPTSYLCRTQISHLERNGTILHSTCDSCIESMNRVMHTTDCSVCKVPHQPMIRAEDLAQTAYVWRALATGSLSVQQFLEWSRRVCTTIAQYHRWSFFWSLLRVYLMEIGLTHLFNPACLVVTAGFTSAHILGAYIDGGPIWPDFSDVFHDMWEHGRVAGRFLVGALEYSADSFENFVRWMVEKCRQTASSVVSILYTPVFGRPPITFPREMLNVQYPWPQVERRREQDQIDNTVPENQMVPTRNDWVPVGEPHHQEIEVANIPNLVDVFITPDIVQNRCRRKEVVGQCYHKVMCDNLASVSYHRRRWRINAQHLVSIHEGLCQHACYWDGVEGKLHQIKFYEDYYARNKFDVDSAIVRWQTSTEEWRPTQANNIPLVYLPEYIYAPISAQEAGVEALTSETWWQYLADIFDRYKRLLAYITASIGVAAFLYAAHRMFTGFVAEGTVLQSAPRSEARHLRANPVRRATAPLFQNVDLQDTVTNYIKRNTFRMILKPGDGKRSRYLYGIGIYDRTALLPKHYVNTLLTWLKPGTGNKIVISFIDTPNLVTEYIPCAQDFEFSAHNDVAAWSALASMNPFKDIRKFIATDADLENPIPSRGLLHVVPEGENTQMTVYDIMIDGFEPSMDVVGSDGNVQEIYDLIKYGYSRKGACGSVLCLPHTQRPIISIHVAGHGEGVHGCGYGIAITRESLGKHGHRPTVNGPEVQGDLSQAKIIFDEHIQVLHQYAVDKGTEPFTPKNTKLRKSAVYGTEGLEVDHEPAILSASDPRYTVVDGKTPLIDGCEKHGSPNKDFPSSWLVGPRAFLESMILPMQPLVASPRKLTPEEAIAGLPLPYYDQMDLNTSVGFPLSNTGKKKKKDWVTIERDQHGVVESVKIDPKLTDILEEAKIKRESGERYLTIFVDTPKDEKRKAEKVRSKGGTRIFCNGPFEHAIAMRQNFMHFSAAFMSHRSKLMHSVGINPCGEEWNELARELLKKNKKISTIDYSNFGPGLKAQVAELVTDIIVKWTMTHVSGVSELEIRALVKECVNCYHMCSNTVYSATSGSPSGAVDTTVINTMVNLIYLLVAWEQIMGPLLREACIAVWQEFKECVALRCYGDDAIYSVAKYSEWYNTQTITAFFAQFGITSTDISKTSKIQPYTSLQEAEYLKRTFAWHPIRQKWMSQLRYESVIAATQWVWSSPNLEASTRVNCEAALMMAHGHGRDKYEELKLKINLALTKHNIDPIIMTWEELDSMIYEYGYVQDY